MKIQKFTLKFVLSVIFIIIAGAINAQDIIKKNNGEEIKAIDLYVGDYEVTYKLYGKPDGETKILKKNLISSIQFSNGELVSLNGQVTTKNVQYETQWQEPTKEVQQSSSALIFLAKGDVIEGIVTEIGLDIVKYKKANNPNGPLYTERQSSILKIQYANGTEDLFGKEATVVNVTEKFRDDLPQNYQQAPSQESNNAVWLSEEEWNALYANTNSNTNEEKAYSPEKKFNPNKFRFYIGTGVGNSYGIIGGNLEFRFSWFAFHGGVGWYPLAPIEIPAWSAGIKFYVWKNMYLNTVVGTVGHYEEHRYYYSGWNSYYSSYYEPITGISELFGYHWAWGNAVRFGLNIGAGITVAFVNKPLIAGSLVAPAFDFGISLSFGTKKRID
jgi:hypothetical protein